MILREIWGMYPWGLILKDYVSDRHHVRLLFCWSWWCWLGFEKFFDNEGQQNRGVEITAAHFVLGNEENFILSLLFYYFTLVTKKVIAFKSYLDQHLHPLIIELFWFILLLFKIEKKIHNKAHVDMFRGVFRMQSNTYNGTCFTKIGNSWKPLNIFAKKLHRRWRLDSKYASGVERGGGFLEVVLSRGQITCMV